MSTAGLMRVSVNRISLKNHIDRDRREKLSTTNNCNVPISIPNESTGLSLKMIMEGNRGP